MARIVIDDDWLTDPRRYRLAELVGSELVADGVMIQAWKTAQDFWRRGKRLIPKPIFDQLPHAKLITEAGLTKQKGASIYLKGSTVRFQWLLNLSTNGKLGGDAKARNQKEKVLANSYQAPSKTLPSNSPSSSNSNTSSSLNTGEAETNSGSKSGDLLILLWNEFSQLPKVKTVTPYTRKLAREAFMEQPSVDFWRSLFAKIESSGFLTGTNKRGWKADFTWVMSKGNYGRIADGSFTGQESEFTEEQKKRIFGDDYVPSST